MPGHLSSVMDAGFGLFRNTNGVPIERYRFVSSIGQCIQ